MKLQNKSEFSHWHKDCLRGHIYNATINFWAKGDAWTLPLDSRTHLPSFLPASLALLRFLFPTLIAGGLQSAILGAILSSVYNNYLRDLTQSRGLKYHLYAHNSHSIGLSPELQIYMSNHLLDHST